MGDVQFILSMTVLCTIFLVFAVLATFAFFIEYIFEDVREVQNLGWTLLFLCISILLYTWTQNLWIAAMARI